jgi:hypothetical protein
VAPSRTIDGPIRAGLHLIGVAVVFPGVTGASLEATHDSYDALAAAHPDLINPNLDDRPLDRAPLAAFAELVRGRRQYAHPGRREDDAGLHPGAQVLIPQGRG